MEADRRDRPAPSAASSARRRYDGTAVFGPVTIGGYLWSLDQPHGRPQWVAPVGDGAHWGNPVATATGVVYTVDLKGFLEAYEGSTGAPLLHHPMVTSTQGDPPVSWGAVSIARNTVYATVGMSALPNGYLIAYRASETVPALPDAPPAPPAPPVPAGDVGAQVLTGPQAQFYGYATPAVVSTGTSPVTYRNVDLVRHDVVQDPKTDGRAGDGSAPWCGRFPAGKCPLFWTELMGLGESGAVQGLSGLSPGTYSFYCTLHPGMRGTLVRS